MLSVVTSSLIKLLADAEHLSTLKAEVWCESVPSQSGVSPSNASLLCAKSQTHAKAVRQHNTGNF